MKHLLFFLFASILAFAAHAQSATATVNGADYVSITGGDPSAKIVSYQWTVTGTPPAAVVISAPAQAQTDFTFTKSGTYTVLLTVKDNLGNVASGTLTFVVYDKQVIHIDFTKSYPNSTIEVNLK